MALRDNDPREIGGYALLDRLGSGGMGTVFLARAESGRPVALKIVHEQFAADAEFRTRFRQEVRAARRVSGAFTAPVVDADPDAARPWMATAYVPGRTLRDRVESEGPLSGAELRVLAVGLVEALRELHQVRVVHRDLKPDNVLLTEDGPRVIDFGISRAPDHQTLTVTGRILGTPPYMSPEQLSTPHRVTPASDVFSLGAVLVYATTGRGPFDAGSPYMTAYNVVHEPPEIAELSGTVREIVQWCLTKEPGERPGPEDLLSAFRAAPEEEWGAPRGPGVTGASPVPTEVSRRHARRKPRLVALATAVALIAGTGVYLLWPEGQPRGTAEVVSAGPSSSTTPSSQAKGRPTPPDAATLASGNPYTPVYGGDPGGLHVYADSPSRRPKGWRPWTAAAGAGACVFAAASLVCVAPGDTPGRGRVSRIDAATGRTLWSKQADIQYDSVPAVAGVTVAVSSVSGVRAFALSDGRALWGPTDKDAIGQLTTDGRSIYGTGQDGTVVCLDPATGKPRWRRPGVSHGIAYPRVRVSGSGVHVLSVEDGEVDAGLVLSLRATDGKTVGTTRLSRPCAPWSLAVVPSDAGDGFGLLVCRASPGEGYHMQWARAGAAYTDLERPGIASLTASARGTFGVIATPRADDAFAEFDVQREGGVPWQVPLGFACDAVALPPVVTGRRAYVVCGQSGVVVDLTRHLVVNRFDLPSPASQAGSLNPGVIVAGGILYAQTMTGWASVDPYATPV
ncbi:serine/threonine-protein kinase [Streptomyces nymphaeiformis]|uniref:Serine/threonine protein kinase n=1 Tax=Streptomyces nymphaeiformis TaxID=2663842 RepID=A0A7W7U909_9ACTN|nr:serine/threonine-protein kinase [Streptomyces nymphaeiformis]MBB4986891.1 serine/threonine protein kinase [Streptomyces nymphaeiformis]